MFLHSKQWRALDELVIAPLMRVNCEGIVTAQSQRNCRGISDC